MLSRQAKSGHVIMLRYNASASGNHQIIGGAFAVDYDLRFSSLSCIVPFAFHTIISLTYPWRHFHFNRRLFRDDFRLDWAYFTALVALLVIFADEWASLHDHQCRTQASE